MYNDAHSKTLEQVLAEVVQSCEVGRPLQAEELYRVYPQYAAELAEFLAANERFMVAAAAARTELASIPVESSQDDSTASIAVGESLALHPPRIFGEYEIVEEIDRGGMGVVYKAVHVHLGRTVALKLIRSGELASEEEKERFRSEAEAAAALTHPGIVPIYEVGTLHGLIYYTMAYIEGSSLADVVSRGAMSPEDAIRIVHSLSLAVDFAHRNGVFHRDLKPANVIIDPHGQPVIIDFGLAKIAHRDSSVTTTGQILGTPAYMAPEQATGKASLGPNADVYSLGAILFCLCSGQPPFDGPTPFDVLLQVLDREPPNLPRLNRKVSRELDYVCHKALEKEPAKRYPSAVDLAADLQRLLRGDPIERPTPQWTERLETWWRREPILASHVIGIGATTAIVGASHIIRNQESTQYPFRMGLLLLWFMASFALQYWVVRARWRDVACMTWATVDVVLYTTLIAFADPPRLMLLIGYPMMIVASSLFYRNRFVIFMTSLCMLGFLSLAVLAPRDEFLRVDFCAIYLLGMGVICLTLLAIIRRVRGMSTFYDIK
ncbi:MAG: serine/threonine-protein kinase [Pirellulaceae bacterium]